MKVYLVRHGEAEASPGAPERSLTTRGQEDTERIAAFLGRMGAEVQAIEHSGKLRARQTAEILGSRVRAQEGVVESDGLMPNDDIGRWSKELNETDADRMLVGHLPFVSILASRLLTGRGAGELLKFNPSSVLCLESTPERGWRIIYFITPDQLLAMPGQSGTI